MKDSIRCLLLLVLMLVGTAQAADSKLIHMIIDCESSGRNDVCGDDGVSCGIAQFQRKTFYEFAQMAHLKHAHWLDKYDQIILLNWGLDHGYANRWTCYRLIKTGEYQRRKEERRIARELAWEKRHHYDFHSSAMLMQHHAIFCLTDNMRIRSAGATLLDVTASGYVKYPQFTRPAVTNSLQNQESRSSQLRPRMKDRMPILS